MTRKYLLYQLLALCLMAFLFVFLSSNKSGQSVRPPIKKVVYCGGVHSIQLNPSSPKLINPKNNSLISSNLVLLVWNKVDDSCTYILKICTDSSFIESKEYVTKDTSFLISSLGSQLFWKVKAQAKNGSESQWSPWSSFKMSPPVIQNSRPCNGNCGSCSHRCGRRSAPPIKQ